ncbi:MAG: class I SAM-dependent methyltransferase [Proteobacteria bacterium]|nr:class I SAM-dependent methyltransferase [Pseudomonadota bacterium]
MSNTALGLTDELAGYLRSVAVREPEVLARLRAETQGGVRAAIMQITPEQGAFMAMLVRMTGAKKTLEVGVYTGYSSTAVALALPDDGRITACDTSEEWTAIARRYWQEAGVDHKIDLHLGPAVETLDELIASGAAGTYDFAFIDADKPNYENYYERCLTLLRAGGMIGIDNVLWSGKVIDQSDTSESTEAIRAINQKVHDDARVDICMLPIGDGLTLARKRANA